MQEKKAPTSFISDTALAYRLSFSCKYYVRLSFECIALLSYDLLHFVAFFHVASLLSTEVDNEKVGVDNEKALELDNRILFSYFSPISI
jgi:hypothetical protein